MRSANRNLYTSNIQLRQKNCANDLLSISFTGRLGAVRLCRWNLQQKQQSLEFAGEISLKRMCPT